MEDYLKKNEKKWRRPNFFFEKLKLAPKKNGRWPQKKMEDDLKKIKNEDDLNFFFIFFNWRWPPTNNAANKQPRKLNFRIDELTQVCQSIQVWHWI